MKRERISKAIWVWAGFSPKDAARLQNERDNISHNLQGPYFTSHLTISGPLINATASSVFNKLEHKLNSDTPSFSTKISHLKISTSMYDGYCYEIAATACLLRLRKNINKALELQNTVWNPHVSLYYGDCDLVERKRQKSIAKLQGEVINIDRLYIAWVDEESSIWDVRHTLLLS